MRRRASGSGLFLTELILVILFFSITAAVYVQVFVGAHTVSKDSVNLTEATLIAQNLAEAFYGCEGDLDRVKALFPDAVTEGNVMTIGFNDEWEPCPSESALSAPYRAMLTIRDSGGSGPLEEAGVKVIGSEAGTDEIYSLKLLRWKGARITP